MLTVTFKPGIVGVLALVDGMLLQEDQRVNEKRRGSLSKGIHNIGELLESAKAAHGHECYVYYVDLIAVAAFTWIGYQTWGDAGADGFLKESVLRFAQIEVEAGVV